MDEQQYQIETPAGPGTLQIARDGAYLRFLYRGPVTERVQRLVAAGGNGTLSLGIPAPRDGALRLEKRFSAAELVELGEAPWRFCLLDADAPLSQHETQPASHPAESQEPTERGKSTSPFSPSPDPHPEGALTRILDGRRLTALPISPQHPFAAPGLMRFGVPERIGDGIYLLYETENGRLKPLRSRLKAEKA